MALKQCNNVINMNSALINAFLDLVLVAFKQSYEQIWMENPNSVFCKMFAWFVAKYSCTSADDCKVNYTAMALEWHPSQGLELLVACLFQGANLPTLPSIPFPTMTSLTSAFVSSIELAFLQRSTRPGSRAAITQPTTWTLPHSVPFGRLPSTLRLSRPPQPCNTAMA
jgi:hypothetical protein